MREHALRRTLLYAAATALILASPALAGSPAHAGTGAARAGVTATTTGTISGRVLNLDGTPTQPTISVYTADEQNYVTTIDSQSDGTFTVDLPAGAYKLDYRIHNAFDQWSGGKTSYETAVPIDVVAGATVQVTETALATGSLGGLLTNADGTAAANVQVSSYQPDVSGAIPSTTTDADGRYRFDDLLPGSYIVAFGGPLYVQQYAHGTLDINAAVRFPVTAGQLTTVDEAFLPLGSLRVIVHDATTGAPVPSFCTYENTNTNISGCTTTGELLLSDIFATSFHFDVTSDDHLHLDVRDAPITVVPGQTTTLDVAMREGASITATMVERSGGTAAPGCVSVANTDDAYRYGAFSYCSDGTPGPTPGSVVIGPLEPGTYQLLADPGDDTLGTQWVGATGGTGDRAAAQQLTVAAGDQVTAPTIRFDKGGTIHGKVTDVTTGAPVPNTCVWIAALSSEFNGSGDCPGGTAADGTYNIASVGPYAWPVEFAREGYQWRWSGNAVNRHSATAVTVQAGKKVAANLKLRTGGGTLTGTIHDSSGNPLDASVVAYDALSGEAVAFSGGLTPEGQPPATFTISNIAPQLVKIFYRTPDGRTGWLGGVDLAHAQTYQIRNNKTLTVPITVP